MYKDKAVFSTLFAMIFLILFNLLGYITAESNITRDCDTMGYFRSGDSVYACIPAKLDK